MKRTKKRIQAAGKHTQRRRASYAAEKRRRAQEGHVPHQGASCLPGYDDHDAIVAMHQEWKYGKAAQQAKAKIMKGDD